MSMDESKPFANTSQECSICNTFVGKWPVATRPETMRRHGNRHHIRESFSWPALLDSAAVCYCCNILVTGCRACFVQHGINETDILRGKLRFYYPLSIEDAETEEAGKELVFFMRGGSRFDVEMFLDAEDEDPPPQAWDCMPTSWRTSPSTDSVEALATIRGWIAKCTADHDFCESPEEPELPTRVVDVGLEDGVVKLVEARGARDKYVCLSHCWGLSQIITTTRSTLQSHKREVPWASLSATFCDAIRLTRSLGFRYLWIDSLCIVQDDPDDWAVESARMAAVYSSGTLTIAAAKACDGRGGLFSQTQDHPVAGQTPAGERYRVVFRELIDHHLESQEETEGDTPVSNATVRYFPLLTRAWVYQERMLSTRVVHFGRYEVCFECRSAFQCECDGFGFDNSSNKPPLPLMKIEHSYALDDSGTEAGFEAERAYGVARLWRSMVCAYTDLYLTMSTDRLPAIGGLARHMALTRGSQYLAGMWRDTLNDDLVWYVHNIARKAARTYSPASQPPTWSWARVDTPVSFWDMILYTGQDHEFEDRQPYEHFARVERCDVGWSAPSVDEFGLICGGQLTITGLVANGRLERDVSRKPDGGEVSDYRVSFAAGEPSLAMQTDYILEHEGPGETRPGTEVFCLRMSRIQEGRTDNLISLVLRRSPDRHEYLERIGVLVIKARPPPVSPSGGPFRDAELRTVTIL